MATAFQERPEIAARFPDLHPPLAPQQATVEANRCLNCFDAPCTAACPTHIDVPGFIKRIASGNLRGSAATILESNVLAESCSRVCPVEVLCEGSCVMHHVNEKPIEIGRLQRFAMERYYVSGAGIPMRQRPERTEKVACIGAGPASLACAAELRQHGFQVTVIDKNPFPGGLNTYGVAEYKLRASHSLAEIEKIREMGVKFCVEAVGSMSDLVRLEREFDFVFLGVGLGSTKYLTPSRGTLGIDALDLISSYKVEPPARRPFTPEIFGQRVVVVGAGNTAIDAAIASKRLGASEVRILYRRGLENLSAFRFEFEHAKREGVEFVWWGAPNISKQDDAPVAGTLACLKTKRGEDGSTVILDEEFSIPCDLLVRAIGQGPNRSFLERLSHFFTEDGLIEVDRETGQVIQHGRHSRNMECLRKFNYEQYSKRMESEKSLPQIDQREIGLHPKYFAGGDCVNGGREVVDAVADGKRAALGISAALNEVQHG